MYELKQQGTKEGGGSACVVQWLDMGRVSCSWYCKGGRERFCRVGVLEGSKPWNGLSNTTNNTHHTTLTLASFKQQT